MPCESGHRAAVVRARLQERKLAQQRGPAVGWRDVEEVLEGGGEAPGDLGDRAPASRISSKAVGHVLAHRPLRTEVDEEPDVIARHRRGRGHDPGERRGPRG